MNLIKKKKLKIKKKNEKQQLKDEYLLVSRNPNPLFYGKKRDILPPSPPFETKIK
jgi:hypothetical protein